MQTMVLSSDNNLSSDEDSDSMFDYLDTDSTENFEDDANPFASVIAGISRLVYFRPESHVAPTGENILNDEITFDKSLLSLHSYLGEAITNVDNRRHFDPKSEVILRAFWYPNIVLVPGFTVPINRDQLDNAQFSVTSKDPVIFLPGCLNQLTDYGKFIGQIGTVADLIKVHRNGVIYLGRQRVCIIEVKYSSSLHQLTCKGVVLPEMTLEEKTLTDNPFGYGLVPFSWSRYAPEPDFVGSFIPTDDNIQTAIDSIERIIKPSSKSNQFINAPLPGNSLAIMNSTLSTWCEPVCESTNENPSDRFSKKRSISPLQFSNEDDLTHSLKLHRAESVEELANPNRQTPDTNLTKTFFDNESKLEVTVENDCEKLHENFCKTLSKSRLLCRRDVLASVAYAMLPFPSWVYRQYDLAYIIAKIRFELSQWTNTWNMKHWSPQLAVPFSYWLIQNLPMSGSIKAKLLALDHVVQRLRATLNWLEKFSGLCCVYCKKEIASQKDIICLSQEGSIQVHVNPSGVAFDLITLCKVTEGSLKLIGTPSEDFSWFPGYAWTCANCAGCYRYLGFLFTAVAEDLQPRLFWGIKRESLKPGSDEQDKDVILM